MPSNATKPSVLVIGYGNVLRSDDGVGCLAAHCIRELIGSASDEVREEQQLTPELAEEISRVDLVIFIDATRNQRAGTVNRRGISPNPATPSLGHHVDPEGLLAMARDLYDRFPRAYVFTVGGERWGYSQSLSPRVEAAMPRLIEDVMLTIKEHVSEAAPCTS